MAKRVVFERKDGTWAWRLKADNGATIATDGSQGYENESDARAIADRIIGGEFKDAEKRSVVRRNRTRRADDSSVPDAVRHQELALCSGRSSVRSTWFCASVLA